jgi:hypothetical protein
LLSITPRTQDTASLVFKIAADYADDSADTFVKSNMPRILPLMYLQAQKQKLKLTITTQCLVDNNNNLFINKGFDGLIHARYSQSFEVLVKTFF